MNTIGPVTDEPTAASVWRSVVDTAIDDHLLEWPPDVFALTDTLLERSDDAGEAGDGLAVPRRVFDVVREGRGRRDAERFLFDVDVDAPFAECGMDAGIEVGDRHSAADVERLGAIVAGAGNQGVVDEVDRDLEGRIAMVQAPGDEAAHVDVQRGVPSVVARGGSGQPDLAEDLAVQVQSVLRGAASNPDATRAGSYSPDHERGVVEVARALVLTGFC